MEKAYMCPSCGNQLLKVTIVENGKDVDKYYCDICDTSYDESKLISKKKVHLIKKTAAPKKVKRKKRARKSSKATKSQQKKV